MATDKKSFILYCDLIDEVDHLTDEEKGRLFQHLLEYVNDMNPVMEDRVVLGSWKHIERQLKRDLVKYETIKEKRSEAGKKSAEVRQQNSANPTSVESVKHRSTNPTVNGTVTVTVNDTVNDKEETDLSLPDPFEKFWNLGLPRVEKRKCQNEWFNIDAPEYPKILEHLPKFIKGSAKYLANPLKYLEGRLWQDEDLPNYADKSKVKNTTVFVVPTDGYGKNSWDE